MMRGVQDTSPEDPDPFTLHIKERYDCEPPIFVLLCQKLQTRARELNHARRKCLRRATWGQNFVRRHFREPEKLAKEPSLRQELVLHDLLHTAGPRKWFECEIRF